MHKKNSMFALSLGELGTVVYDISGRTVERYVLLSQIIRLKFLHVVQLTA